MLRAKWMAVALLVTLLLSGCESLGRGPTAISRDGEDVLIALCTELDSPRLSAGVETSDGWSTFLDANTAATLPGDTVLRSGPLPEGFAGTFSRFDFNNVRGLVITFEGSGKDQSVMSAFDGSPDVQIPATGWLHTDGRVTTVACGSTS
jgi:hypothetical protein